MAAYQQTRMSSNYVPGGYDDEFYTPPAAPELISPEPQRHMPEMSNQIQHGLQNMTLDQRDFVPSPIAHDYHQSNSTDYTRTELPRFSPFPKLTNQATNVPPSDDEIEETLWNARNLVLDSTDPEMQLAWAADALVYVGVSADNEERIAAAKPSAARSITPSIEHALKADAMNIVTFLSSQHHPKAEFLQGMWLEWGRYGQREDKKEAFRCYSRAADKGYARAEYRIGMLYESFNDATKALRHYHRGVDAGDSASYYRLGMMTLRGQHGQQQDWQRAIELIRQSAETADENAAQGAYVYGMLLARQLPQINVPETALQPDESRARMYIEKAAFLKFAKAQLKMGNSYELGALGCDFNPALSIHYYALASKQGETEADMALSKWFLVGHAGVFAKNEELSFIYAERAAATGLATAEFALGYFHEIGMYVPIDLHKSMEWYGKAAQHGNDDAKGRIDALHKRQYLSKKDHEQVAISRIKSMHNSMRGARPDRRPSQTPRLGQLPEGAPYETDSQHPLPARATSAAPYPLTDQPLPPPSARSNSAVPYPLDDNPSSIYASQSWAAAQPTRPATTAYMGQHQPYQQQARPNHGGLYPQPERQYQGGPPPAQSPRPDAYLPPAQSSRSDAYPPPGRQAPDQRVMSSPNLQQHQGGFGSQSSPRPGQFPASASGAPYQKSQPQMSRMDIGYSAPQEARRRPSAQGMPPQGRLPQGRPAQGMPPQSRPPQSMQSQGRPAQGMQSQGRPPSGTPSQGKPPPGMQSQQGRPPPGMSPQQGRPPPGMTTQQGRPPQGLLQQSHSTPNMSQSRPSGSPAVQQNQGFASRPPVKESAPQSPVRHSAPQSQVKQSAPQPSVRESASRPSVRQSAPQPVPAPAPAPAPTPAPTSASSKPLKGPTTFEEMGVAAKKNGEDCVVM